MRLHLGACPTLTFLLRRMIRDHLSRARPDKILNGFQRIHLRIFRACGLASGRISFASSRPAMSVRFLVDSNGMGGTILPRPNVPHRQSSS